MFCMGAAAAQAPNPSLPDAPAKAVMMKSCTACHEIDTVTAVRRTRIGWQQTVDDMAGRGAEGTDDEMNLIVDYLTKYFGKINVNTASAEEIEHGTGLSAKDAKAIADYREEHGKFKDFEELKKVPGVRAEELQAKRGLIAFSL